MGVLAGSRHPDGARPVVVHVGQLVADLGTGVMVTPETSAHLLDDVRLEPRVVVDHYVVSGRDGALPHVLRHQEEVVPVPAHHGGWGKNPKRFEEINK